MKSSWWTTAAPTEPGSCCGLKAATQEVRPIKNEGLPGFGRAVIRGLDQINGDAVVVMMADESDDCRDVVRYWQELNQGWDCVFGSRFINGGGVIDYPGSSSGQPPGQCLPQNPLCHPVQRYHQRLQGLPARRIDGCRPLISPHFNLTVELPLKAVVRGYSWTVIPITWRNRRAGKPKLKIGDGQPLPVYCLYVWLG